MKLNAGEAVYVIPFNPEQQRKDDAFIYDETTGDNGVWFGGESNWVVQP